MTILNADLTQLGFGLEAPNALGTLVAATKLVPFTTGSFRPMHEFNNVDEMRGIIGDYEDVLVGQMCDLQITQALDYENILPAFLAGFEGSAVSGTQAPYTWTFTPGRDAPVDLLAATVEVNQSDGDAAHFRRRFGYARPTAIGIELAEGVATMSTTWMGRAAQALAAPADVAPVERTLIPGRLFQVFIDDDWASLGTTLVGQLRTASISYNPGLAPANNKAGRADLDLTDWYRARFQGSVALTVDHAGPMTAELEHHFANDLRFVRLQATVGTGAAEKLLRLDHCVRYLTTPDTFQADAKQHVLELVGEIRADTTAAANQFEAQVKNGVGSW